MVPSYFFLAHSPPNFASDMTTYYCLNMEEALRRAKKAGRFCLCLVPVAASTTEVTKLA